MREVCCDQRTLRMIKDAGFSICSDVNLDDLLSRPSAGVDVEYLKNLDELRPFQREK